VVLAAQHWQEGLGEQNRNSRVDRETALQCGEGYLTQGFFRLLPLILMQKAHGIDQHVQPATALCHFGSQGFQGWFVSQVAEQWNQP
jgi:hypothetical protein